jgi:hypothetical protein
MQPRQAPPEVQVQGQPQAQGRRPSIAREFLTAGIALWLILTSTKLLLYTTNLYHSTDFEVHRNWLAITHHPYYDLAPKPVEVRDRPSEPVPDYPHGNGETPRNPAEATDDAINLAKGWKYFSDEFIRYVQEISWIRDARYWYREGQYSIWTLDYPPLFALFECFLSRTIVPAAQGVAPLILHKQSPSANSGAASTGYSRVSWWNASYVVGELDRMVTLSETENASPIVQYFQRATVIIFSDWPLHLSLVLFCTLLVRRVRDRNLYRWRRIRRSGSPGKRSGDAPTTTILSKAESRDDIQTGSQSDTSTGAATRVRTRPTPQGVIQAKRESTWLLASLPPISQPWLSGMACSLILCITLHPIFIMVDAVHFQYNSLLFALLVLSSLFVLFGHVATAAFLFVSLIFAKHLFLYYSLGLAAWGLWLVWKTLTRPENGANVATRMVKAILLVVRCLLAAGFAVSLALLPFFVSETLHQYEAAHGPLTIISTENADEGIQAVGQGILRTAPILLEFLAQPKRFESVARETVTPMVERMFPFGRGLCHSFWAPNAYPILNVIDRLACKYMTMQHRSKGDHEWKCPESSTNTRGIVGLHNTAKALDDPENIKAAQFATLPSHSIIGDVTPFVSNCLVLTCFIVGLTRHQFRFSSGVAEQSSDTATESDAKKESKGKSGAAPQSPPTPAEKKSSASPTRNPYREGLTNLRALLWLLFASSGSFFLFGFHVHEKAILTVLFPIFLLAMLAMAEYVETQRHLRFTLQELVEETAVHEAAVGKSADSPVPLSKDSPSSKALAELTRRLIKQVYYFSMVVRRIRVLLALAVVLSFAGGLTVLPLLYEFREIPLKYCLVLGHVACLLMIDCHVCIAGLRHLEVIHHICGSDATIQKVIQSQSAMALRPLLSAFEKTLLFLVMLPVAIYADATTVLADWRGRPTEFLPLLLLSLCGSLVLVNAIFFKGARIAGA